jgi:hypothetical protein
MDLASRLASRRTPRRRRGGLGRRLRPGTVIFLETMLAFDTILLIAAGAILLLFMKAPAGPVFGGACWLAAAGLQLAGRVAGRRYRRGADSLFKRK